MEIITLLATQVPALAALIWFLVFFVKQSDRRFEQQRADFQNALDKIVDKIGERLERVESKVDGFSGVHNQT
ncbi:hypothetical protein FACS189454_08690 [Planctomycetales bacterium]|nr:hypothetical protein FACS189454_08690 [Planctomycetales bacterium]